MKLELIKIVDIKILKSLYPRAYADKDETINRYAQEMKLGAIFPPIKVCPSDKIVFDKGVRKKGKYILIDGRNRLSATRRNHEEYIQAEVYEPMTNAEVLIEAIKSNREHGLPLSDSDLKYSAKKLLDLKVDISSISNLLMMPVQSLTRTIPKQIINKLHESGELPAGITGDEEIKQVYDERIVDGGFIIAKFYWLVTNDKIWNDTINFGSTKKENLERLREIENWLAKRMAEIGV